MVPKEIKMKVRNILLLLSAVALFLAGCAGLDGAFREKPSQLTVYYTANTWGNVKPCPG